MLVLGIIVRGCATNAFGHIIIFVSYMFQILVNLIFQIAAVHVEGEVGLYETIVGFVQSFVS